MPDLKQFITETAFELGFDAVGITLANDLNKSNEHFVKWREAGFAGEMKYLLRENPVNAKPKQLLSQAKSIITLLVNYYTKPPEDPGPDYGRVALYAVGEDYHKVIRKKLNILQEKLRVETGKHILAKGFSDSVPLLEKSIARNSGLGFLGKNTLLINKSWGSYFFICELILDLEIEPTEEIKGTCGKCIRCVDICPTNALSVGATHELPILDARLCISYLTIENRGTIQTELRENIGNWVYGCDLCQLVCPYNKKRKETTWQEFKPENGVGHYLNLKEVLKIRTDEEFYYKFGHTPLTRARRKGLIRNAAIVAGNRLSEEALGELIWLAENEVDPVLREHALWALSKYKDRKAKELCKKYDVNELMQIS